MLSPDEVQSVLRHALRDVPQAETTPINIGVSGAAVFRITTADGRREIVKIDHADSPNSLAQEHAVLCYTTDRLPAPAPLELGRLHELEFLRMSALPGMDGAEPALLSRPFELVNALAAALRRLHALPIAECPFDRRTAVMLDQAQARLARGVIGPHGFDHPTPPDQLLAHLRQTQPAVDLVVAHGDYCHPNIIFDPATLALSGFVDLGRLGVADRWLDLGIAARSIMHNLSYAWVMPFFAAYGIQPDWAKAHYFQNLDEFF